ncbi:adenosine receptor A1-like [Microcaecilia unicolor]|uniref:Adenosine receptor A1-like n=1 Tax=Microcaecilia unicolor TaxID=1415580 RepID=A0A6P7WXT3_9AMPH|nr:adenosine receptor A1-like [Microcaecilia unicolor]
MGEGGQERVVAVFFYRVLLGVSLPICLTLALFIILGNVFILRLLLRRSEKDGITLVMVSLVISDLGIGLFCFPMVMLSNSQIVLPFYPCLWLTCTSTCWLLVSSLHHMLIATDRWYKVTWPTRYASSMTRSRAAVHIATCWALAISFSFIPVLGYNNFDLLVLYANGSGLAWQESGHPLEVICQYLVVLNLNYLVYILFFICTLIPVLVISLLYLLMFLKLGLPCQSQVACEGIFQQKQRQITVNMVITVLVYALLKIPYCTLNCLFLYCPNCTVPYWTVPFASTLILCSAIFNPFIIFFSQKEGRSSLAQGARRRKDAVVGMVETACGVGRSGSKNGRGLVRTENERRNEGYREEEVIDPTIINNVVVPAREILPSLPQF